MLFMFPPSLLTPLSMPPFHFFRALIFVIGIWGTCVHMEIWSKTLQGKHSDYLNDRYWCLLYILHIEQYRQMMLYDIGKYLYFTHFHSYHIEKFINSTYLRMLSMIEDESTLQNAEDVQMPWVIKREWVRENERKKQMNSMM